ncbi:MAG: patatin-like phospholipase family protein [Candidatus Woesearchaeota archaeon]
MITLVLGSGGAKGLAHIGVLKRLEEKNIKPKLIIGSSMGAVVGAMYASGTKIETIEKAFLELNSYKLLDFQGFNPGIMSGTKIRDFFKKYMKEDFKELDIKIKINAIDINTGKEVILTKGNLIDSVLASMSIPGLFKPVTINGKELLDIGFTNPVPINLVKKAKEVIISDVSSELEKLPTKNTINILIQVFNISQKNAGERTYKRYEKELTGKVTYLRPKVGKYGLFDFVRKKQELEKIIKEGYKEAKKNIR